MVRAAHAGSRTRAVDGDGDGDPIKFDMAALEDLGNTCEQGGGELEFSYVWVTSSELESVSKIDTVTATELARYRTTSPMNADPNPSRTSVNRLGDVVVANRNGGGVTKVFAQLDSCVDQDQDAMITTSLTCGCSAASRPWADEGRHDWIGCHGSPSPVSVNQR